MIESFETTTLVAIFRSGLLSLLPVMDAARIRWTEPGVYDPWEDIERTLYSSIVGSCVENAVPGGLRPLATYGLSYLRYDANSFVSERKLRERGSVTAFVKLQTDIEPFDTAALSELDDNLIPTGRTLTKPIASSQFDLASSGVTGVEYRSSVAYEF